MSESEKRVASSPRVALPGYLGGEPFPEVADILYFPSILYWLPTGFSDIEYRSLVGFPLYCREHNTDLPDATWSLLAWYREADKRAAYSADILQPLHEARMLRFLLPSYGRGKREIEIARAAITSDSALRESLGQAPFDACLFARELVGHALFGVFVEGGYEESVRVFRAVLGDEAEFQFALAAPTINRIATMLATGMIPVVYDQRWIPLFEAIQSNKVLHLMNNVPVDGLTDDNDWSLEYSTFRVFSEILRPVFGVCDSKVKSSWVAQMRVARADDIAKIRSECKDIAVSMLATSGETSGIRTEILRRELQHRIADPLEALTSESQISMRELTKDVIFDSSVVGAILAVFTNFDPRVTAISIAGATLASIGRRIVAPPSAPSHLGLLRDGLIATEGEYAALRHHLLSVAAADVSR